MLDNKRIGRFLSEKRKEIGLTQQQVADRLNISFQSVSKWEQGVSYPNTSLLRCLAKLFRVSVDELLDGFEKGEDTLSYSKAGVDIAYTDSIKKDMAKHLRTDDKRVLNGLGPFASLYDITFPELSNPVLVLKSEEPGSKQKLAMEYGYTESICADMINHLVNDIAVMGAKPLAVLDTIVCSNAQKDTISSLVKGISDACRENECALVGGETSIQPSVVASGVYILTSSIAGIVSRDKILDGSAIENGDSVLAAASNGLHTNGYSLVRLLMEKQPQVKLDKIDGLTFIEQIMKPHTAYYKAIKGLLPEECIHGMAHITGGSIEGNLCRVIPEGLSARIDLGSIRIPSIFRYIKAHGNIPDAEMLSTFNCGVGLILIVKQEQKKRVMEHISAFSDCYEIGKIERNDRKIQFSSTLKWD